MIRVYGISLSFHARRLLASKHADAYKVYWHAWCLDREDGISSATDEGDELHLLLTLSETRVSSGVRLISNTCTNPFL